MVENVNKYKKQKNCCSKFYTERNVTEFYSNLDIKSITGNKLFWKTFNPFLSDKYALTSKTL